MATRILVINDTQEILEIFREILEDEGYEVVLYSFAISDMHEIERIKPDLIIADYMFGNEMAGWQLLQKLKMRRATANIPVVICTAATMQVREIEGYLEANGIGLVPKPFDIDDLLLAVRRALEAPRHAAGLVKGRATEHATPENRDAQDSKGSKGGKERAKDTAKEPSEDT